MKSRTAQEVLGLSIEARTVRELCERRDAPNYLVLNAPVDGFSGIEWSLPADIGSGRQSLFLYDCHELQKWKRPALGRPFLASPSCAYIARQTT